MRGICCNKQSTSYCLVECVMKWWTHTTVNTQHQETFDVRFVGKISRGPCVVPCARQALLCRESCFKTSNEERRYVYNRILCASLTTQRRTCSTAARRMGVVFPTGKWKGCPVSRIQITAKQMKGQNVITTYHHSLCCCVSNRQRVHVHKTVFCYLKTTRSCWSKRKWPCFSWWRALNAMHHFLLRMFCQWCFSRTRIPLNQVASSVQGEMEKKPC